MHGAADVFRDIWTTARLALEATNPDYGEQQKYEKLQEHGNQIVALCSRLSHEPLEEFASGQTASRRGDLREKIGRARRALTLIEESAGFVAQPRNQPDRVVQEQLERHAQRVVTEARELMVVLELDDSECSSSTTDQCTLTSKSSEPASVERASAARSSSRSNANIDVRASEPGPGRPLSRGHLMSDTPVKRGCQDGVSVASMDSELPQQRTSSRGSQDLQGFDDILSQFEQLPSHHGVPAGLGSELGSKVVDFCKAETTRGSFPAVNEAWGEIKEFLEMLMAKPGATKRAVLDGFLEEFG